MLIVDGFGDVVLLVQGGFQADLYKWSDMGPLIEWPKMNGFHWG